MTNEQIELHNENELRSMLYDVCDSAIVMKNIPTAKVETAIVWLKNWNRLHGENVKKACNNLKERDK